MIRYSLRAVALSATVAAAGFALAAPAQAGVTSAGPQAGLSPAAAKPDPAAARQAREAGCPRGPSTYDIGYGDSGTRVSEVQCLLNHTLSWNAYPHSIPQSGYYDSTTVAAVRVFQVCVNNRGGGIGVDGRVGRQTLPHLRWWGQHTNDTGEVMC